MSLSITLDTAGMVMAVAPPTAERLGYSVAELIGQPGRSLVHPKDCTALSQRLQRLAMQPDSGDPIRLLRRDRTSFSVQLSLQRMQATPGSDSILLLAVPIQAPFSHTPAVTQPSCGLEIYRAIVDTLPNTSVWLFDPDLRHVLASRRALDEKGLTQKTFLGKTLWQIWPTLSDQVEPLYRMALAGYEASQEVNQGDRTSLIHALPIRNDQGQVVLGMIVCQDVTSLKQAEQALQLQAETERRHRLIAQTSAEFSRHIRHSFDLEKILASAVTQIQKILDADRVLFYRIYTETTGEILTESCSAPELSIFHHTRGLQNFAPECLQQYKQGKPWTMVIEEDNLVDCSQCFLNTQVQAKLVVPILLQGQLWGLLSAQQCTTTRIWQRWECDLMNQLGGQLELAVYQSELYQQVQQMNSHLEVQIQLRTAQLQQANDFEATLKRITDRVRDSLDEDQILQAAVRELATVIRVGGCNAALYDLSAGTSTVRYEHTTTDLPYHGRVIQLATFPDAYTALLSGRPIQFCSLSPNPIRGMVSTLAVPILDDKGVLGDLWLVNHKEYAFSEQDIRLVQQVANQCAIALRQARLYQASIAQVRELERLNQLKDDFLSTVSHELRTPMSNVKMAIQMLEILLRQPRKSPDEMARIDRYLKILREESQREINLINDLLDLSRLDSSTDTLQFVAIDMAQWLPLKLQVFEEQATAQHQTLQIQVPDKLPVLTTDTLKLERILTELLTNAFKYTPAQETICVAMDEVVQNDQVISLRLSVTNTGTEIPPEEQARIFDKFYRIPNNDPWQYGGTGLGLALVKQMTQQLGGTLSLDSQNQQTCFTVELPIHPLMDRPQKEPFNAPAWLEAPSQSSLVTPDR